MGRAGLDLQLALCPTAGRPHASIDHAQKGGTNGRGVALYREGMVRMKTGFVKAGKGEVQGGRGRGKGRGRGPPIGTRGSSTGAPFGKGVKGESKGAGGSRRELEGASDGGPWQLQRSSLRGVAFSRAACGAQTRGRAGLAQTVSQIYRWLAGVPTPWATPRWVVQMVGG
jgi:hypothetical protein